MIKGNTNDNDYVKISGGGGIDIKTKKAFISGSEITLKSIATNQSLYL